MPWAALWLFYFEEWLGSDDWKGGGEHPTPPRDRPGRRRVNAHYFIALIFSSRPAGQALASSEAR